MPTGKEQTDWRKLDNAAKLFSAASNEKDTRVFRFYCELKEVIEPAILQEALDATLLIYPVFLSVMRKGLFWHYLEKSELKPKIFEEYRDPCSTLYVRDKKALLFEVTYYEKRINFEIFHALTDGTGALEFLRELVKQYLHLRYKEQGVELVAKAEIDTPTVQEQENDSFLKYYSTEKINDKVKKAKAYQLRKNGADKTTLNVAEFHFSASKMLAKSKEMGVSVTILISAILIKAIHEEMSRLQERRPVTLMVPVNLRNFFPSSSMLNFFGWIEPYYDFQKGSGSLEDIIAVLKKYFKDKLTIENVSSQMNRLIAFELHPILKITPLVFKNLAIVMESRRQAQDVTAVFSNLGVVKMDEEYIPYIDYFGVYTSTPKLEASLCTFEDDLYLAFTSRFDTTNIQNSFLRIVESLDIKTEDKETKYPEVKRDKLRSTTFFKILSFSCIAVSVIAFCVNYILMRGNYWSFFVIAGTASLWTSLTLGYKKRHNLLKNAIWQLVLITLVCLLWDYRTGWHGWSVDYVFPGTSLAVMASMFIIAQIQAHSAREYMIYFIMAAFYSFTIPFILLLTGAVTVIYPSVISAAIGFLVVIALMMFKWREFKEEIEKNFHV